jgi:hypothetical protein
MQQVSIEKLLCGLVLTVLGVVLAFVLWKHTQHDLPPVQPPAPQPIIIPVPVQPAPKHRPWRPFQGDEQPAAKPET